MTDSDDRLSVLLDRAAERLEVGAPPTDRILTGRRRTHRRLITTRIIVAAVAVLVMITSALAATWTDDGGRADRVVPAGPGPSASMQYPVDTDLDGSWTVTALVGADPTRSALPESYRGRVVLTFDATEVTGTTGCNNIGASYVQGGDDDADITFRERGTTQAACVDEPPVFERLGAVRHVGGSGDTRYLYAADRQIIFELTRR